MGAVYEVTDIGTQRRRALKTMLPDIVADTGLRARFRDEAIITSQVDSEHLVEVFDAGIDAATDTPFMVMELLRGEDIGELLERRKRLPADEVVLLLSQASHALDRTHAVGIVHRDLKPENLFITQRDDGSPRLRILDFGIAKLLTQSSRAKTTGIVGTPLYMAPEQAVGESGYAVDIYALGHIAFTMLVGEAFWESTARRVSPVVLLTQIAQGATGTATPRAQEIGVTLPAGFDDWFATATAHLPSERFETASELVDALAVTLGVALPGRSSAATADARLAATVRVDAQKTCKPLAIDSLPMTRRWVSIPIGVAGGGLILAAILVWFLAVQQRSAPAGEVDRGAPKASSALLAFPPEPPSSVTSASLPSSWTDPSARADAPPERPAAEAAGSAPPKPPYRSRVDVTPSPPVPSQPARTRPTTPPAPLAPSPPPLDPSDLY